MRNKICQRLHSALYLSLVLCLAAVATAAQQVRQNIPREKLEDARETSRKAAEAFREIAVLNERIPEELLNKAEAIAVFPNVTKVAFIGGARWGEGLLSRRTPAGWSAPVFFGIKGGSAGFQIGTKSTDFILLLMTDSAVRQVMEGEFDLGAAANAVAGPVWPLGKAQAGGGELPAGKEIITYSRTDGLFAGATLTGVKITPENDLNRAFYGRDSKALLGDLASLSVSALPAGVEVFPRTLGQQVQIVRQ